MNPRLVVIAGSLAGEVFALTEEKTSIGRETMNRVAIKEDSVSRHHCLIEKRGEGYALLDAESLNGTFVNDVPVKERLLKHGDEIRIGDSRLLFLTDDGEDAQARGSIRFDDTRLDTNAVVRLRAEDAFRVMARDLHALVKISTTINSVREPEPLQRELLALIAETVPAEHAAILLAHETDGETDDNEADDSDTNAEDFASVVHWHRNADAGQPACVSRTIIRQVMREGIALLSNDVETGATFDPTESLLKAGTRSLLCLPLRLFDRTFGVIYLDAARAGARFDEDHLHLLSAIASVAAVAIENARHVEGLESENRRLRAELNFERDMIGEGERMRAVYDFIARVAPTDSTVLITGESGTGKELAARALHTNSPRAPKPFAAINCAALTETLLESELFGHERGAFTGAVAQKKGKLETADGGTLFLDEVAEMSPVLQAKLLRVIQEREFEPVGGTRLIRVDVRLVAATNKDLEELMRRGAFREDLYYRLNVVSLRMPPLRERREDIPLLANFFVRKYAERCKRPGARLSPQALACLRKYEWRGNVRELENAIESAVVLGASDVIRPEDLPDAVLDRASREGVTTTQFHASVRERKKELILAALDQAHGNYTEAAKLLGLHPNYLHRLIRNLDLKAAIEKPDDK